MAEPFLWVVEVFKVLVQVIIGIVLLYRWSRTERHFLTDLPFIFAISIFISAGGESMDAVSDFGFNILADLFIFKIRATFIVLSLSLWVTATIFIWFVERRNLGIGLALAYVILFMLGVWLAPTEALVRLVVMPFLFILFISFIATFLAAYAMKRLPDVHGLLLASGVIVAMFGQILKFLSPIGPLLLVSELIDLLGLVVIASGFFIKPGYAKT